MDLQCTKCGSDKIMPLASLLDQGEYSDGSLKAVVAYTNPEAWIFKGAITTRLRASMCGECGFTELFAENPKEMYQAYLRAQATQQQ